MVWFLLALAILPFGFVLFFGAPYLPTRRRQAAEGLDMLGLKKGEVFVDLGSGDGSVLIEAARRGLVCYGYELNPFVWFVSWLRTRRFGGQVKVYCRNFWRVSLPKDTRGVFVFLLDPYMAKLDAKLAAELKGGRLVSYTFQIPGKKPLTAKRALYLYQY